MQQSKLKTQPIRILITLGPTRAYLDGVRFLSNYSTGRLGFLICRELLRCGFRVTAIVGPCEQNFSELKGLKLVRVETPFEMNEAVLKEVRLATPQFAILAAAVLDFAPKRVAKGKTPSTQKSWKIELIPTPKIVDELSRKFPEVRKLGFKLEWKSMGAKQAAQFAKKNMQEKGLEALVLNFLPTIKEGKHPAFLYTLQGLVKKANTKESIALWIADYIKTISA